MNLKDIILEKIEAVGADGLCSPEAQFRGRGWRKDNLPASLGTHLLLANAIQCEPEECKHCDCYCDGYDPDAHRYFPIQDENSGETARKENELP